MATCNAQLRGAQSYPNETLEGMSTTTQTDPHKTVQETFLATELSEPWFQQKNSPSVGMFRGGPAIDSNQSATAAHGRMPQYLNNSLVHKMASASSNNQNLVTESQR